MGSSMKVRQNVGARIGQLSVLELGFMYEGGKMEAHRVGPRIGNVCHADPHYVRLASAR